MNFRCGGSGDSGNVHNFYGGAGSEKMFGKTTLSPLMSPRANVMGQHDASPVAIVAIQGFFPFFPHERNAMEKRGKQGLSPLSPLTAHQRTLSDSALNDTANSSRPGLSAPPPYRFTVPSTFLPTTHAPHAQAGHLEARGNPIAGKPTGQPQPRRERPPMPFLKGITNERIYARD